MKHNHSFKRLALLAFTVFALFANALPVQAVAPKQPPAPTATPSACTPDQAFELPSHALGLVCVPSAGWNGNVIVYAHGYVDPTEQQPMFDNLGASFSALAQGVGYAFAATTYRRNGLVVQEGVQDLRELVAAIPGKVGRTPSHVYVLGISEGGLIATLFAERNPLALDGVLAACGPIGDFKRQINYFGDFRVLFDYYFPSVLPGDAVTIPNEVIADWDSVYVPKIAEELKANSDKAASLITDSGATIDLSDATAVVSKTIGLLRYNVFSTNDAKQRLGGNPYDNVALRARFPAYNLKPYNADPVATAALDAYQTSGRVAVPMITAHTTGDEIVPVWHQQLYTQKAQNNGFVSHRTFSRYGHCAFGGSDLLIAFTELAQHGAQLRRVYLPFM